MRGVHLHAPGDSGHHAVVGSISGFIAVIRRKPPAELIRLAADCVARSIRSVPTHPRASRAAKSSLLTPSNASTLIAGAIPT